MSAAEQLIDKQELLHLAPFSILTPELLDEVIACATVKRLPPGKKAFKAGDNDNEAVFLLSGQLALISEGQPTTIIKAGSTDATKPVEDQKPRQTTALASTNVTILSVDYDLLDQIIARNRDAKTQAKKMAALSTEQRIEHILNMPIFRDLPPPYKKNLKAHLSLQTYSEGETVFSEGSRNDYFYIISEGSAYVTRRSPQSGQVVDVTELNANDGFGEESLIANGKHNATVSLKEDSAIFRVPRQEFMSLIVKPSIRWVDINEATAEQSMGAIILDVRMPSHFIAKNIPGSINLPLPVLRKTATILNNDKEYIIYSDNPIQSLIASFLLTYRGIKVQTVKGSLKLQ